MIPTPSGLVGRDRPLAELQALVEAALASRGGVVALTGEAGIGKTTLAAAAADHAEQRGATVVWGVCWEGAPPFWPWLEALAALGVDAGLQDRGRTAALAAPSSPAARSPSATPWSMARPTRAGTTARVPIQTTP